MAWNVSRWPGMFPDGLECFQIVWKVSRWPQKFPDCLETFFILQRTFQVYKNFPGSIATLLPWFFRLWVALPLNTQEKLIQAAQLIAT